MNWLSTIIRVAGSQFPGISALIQLQSELESAALEKRVAKLEDPISFLHEDIHKVSKIIYTELRSSGSLKIVFEAALFERFSRSLAALDANKYIECKYRLGRSVPIWIWLNEPSYLLYLGALFESSEKLNKLVEILENCKVGEWLDGRMISTQLDLSVAFVQAFFSVYERKGYGICSREIGSVNYCGRS